jgi:hypothetical protein
VVAEVVAQRAADMVVAAQVAQAALELAQVYLLPQAPITQ